MNANAVGTGSECEAWLSCFDTDPPAGQYSMQIDTRGLWRLSRVGWDWVLAARKEGVE